MDDEDLDLIAKKFRKNFKPKKGEKQEQTPQIG
jgi:hypothetical protein